MLWSVVSVHFLHIIALNLFVFFSSGEYICLFVQKNNLTTIKHKASATLDICLIPTIQTSTEPAFPRCKANGDVLLVTIKCEIAKTDENYTVTWSEHAIPEMSRFGKKILFYLLILFNEFLCRLALVISDMHVVIVAGERTQIYTAKKVISCDQSSTEVSTKAEASCSFKNSCGQNTAKDFNFAIIHCMYYFKYCFKRLILFTTSKKCVFLAILTTNMYNELYCF